LHTRFSRDWSSDVCSSDLRRRAFYGLCDTESILVVAGEQMLRRCAGGMRPYSENWLNASMARAEYTYAAPAFKAMAVPSASATSSAVAPAWRAAAECEEMQPSQRVVTATASA